MTPQEKKLNDLRKDAVKNAQLYGLKKTQLKKKIFYIPLPYRYGYVKFYK